MVVMVEGLDFGLSKKKCMRSFRLEMVVNRIEIGGKSANVTKGDREGI